MVVWKSCKHAVKHVYASIGVNSQRLHPASTVVSKGMFVQAELSWSLGMHVGRVKRRHFGIGEGNQWVDGKRIGVAPGHGTCAGSSPHFQTMQHGSRVIGSVPSNEHFPLPCAELLAAQNIGRTTRIADPV